MGTILRSRDKSACKKRDIMPRMQLLFGVVLVAVCLIAVCPHVVRADTIITVDLSNTGAFGTLGNNKGSTVYLRAHSQAGEVTNAQVTTKQVTNGVQANPAPTFV